MDYEEEDEKSGAVLIAIALVVVGLAVGGIYYLLFGADSVKPAPSPPVVVEEAPSSPPPKKRPAEQANPDPAPTLEPEPLDVKVEALKPELATEQIAKILQSGDLDRAARALGGTETGASAQALEQFLNQNGEPLRLKQIREVGELETGRRKRFAIEWEGGVEPLFLDLAKGEDQKWAVEQVRLPAGAQTKVNPDDSPSPEQASPLLETSPPAAADNDSLTISDKFLQAALSQDFGNAKSFVDTGKVSDAKIAAMCILFEEGKYRLNPAKPLRVMFNRETRAAYLANVLTNEADKPAQFGVNLSRADATSDWKVSEINLDSLLADYANRVAGGDVHYTPLVPNPQGGETLVIFFGFDEETLAPRTQRQLRIVADVLKTDPNRKLTLSGHADALGSDEYNNVLSKKRAASVHDFLTSNGVTSNQIVVVAEGESRPRRPNETDTGEDDPEGRRANRRTEIYLDFGTQ